MGGIERTTYFFKIPSTPFRSGEKLSVNASLEDEKRIKKIKEVLGGETFGEKEIRTFAGNIAILFVGTECNEDPGEACRLIINEVKTTGNGNSSDFIAITTQNEEEFYESLVIGKKPDERKKPSFIRVRVRVGNNSGFDIKEYIDHPYRFKSLGSIRSDDEISEKDAQDYCRNIFDIYLSARKKETAEENISALAT